MIQGNHHKLVLMKFVVVAVVLIEAVVVAFVQTVVCEEEVELEAALDIVASKVFAFFGTLHRPLTFFVVQETVVGADLVLDVTKTVLSA